jgi:hypothetical protein
MTGYKVVLAIAKLFVVAQTERDLLSLDRLMKDHFTQSQMESGRL